MTTLDTVTLLLLKTDMWTFLLVIQNSSANSVIYKFIIFTGLYRLNIFFSLSFDINFDFLDVERNVEGNAT